MYTGIKSIIPISFYSTIDIVFRIKNRNSEWTTRQRSPLSLLACSSVAERWSYKTMCRRFDSCLADFEKGEMNDDI